MVSETKGHKLEFMEPKIICGLTWVSSTTFLLQCNFTVKVPSNPALIFSFISLGCIFAMSSFRAISVFCRVIYAGCEYMWVSIDWRAPVSTVSSSYLEKPSDVRDSLPVPLHSCFLTRLHTSFTLLSFVGFPFCA